MKPYTEYKESGIEWLGKIPIHWDNIKLKYLLIEPLKYGANESAELDDPKLPRYIRITDIDDNGNLRDETFKSIPEESAESYMLKQGDLLLARSGATVGKSFLFKEEWGRAAYAGYLIRARVNPGILNPYFLAYFLRSSNYWEWISNITIQATIQNVSAEKYDELKLSIPPIPEQHTIAAYLDRETSRIDTLITKKQRQIELLQEKRSALISHVVTKGLDTDVKMKDSGVEWLGEVPEHWEVKPIKRVISEIVDNRGRTPEIVDDGIPMLEVDNIEGLNNFPKLDAINRYISEDTYDNFLRDYLKAGDILFATVGATAGKTSIVPPSVNFCIIQNLVAFRVSPDNNFKYFYYYLKSNQFRTSMLIGNKSNTIDNIKVTVIIQEKMPIPSKYEQVKIAECLDKETTKIDDLILKINESITYLKEYRTALISAAVTGKIDVRDEVETIEQDGEARIAAEPGREYNK